MTDEEVMEQINLATGYGLAALSLQSAIAAELFLRGISSSGRLANLFDAAEQVAGAGLVSASKEAVLIAQGAIRGLSERWRQPDKQH